MPTGTPYTLKCRRCKRGMNRQLLLSRGFYGLHAGAERARVERTGRVEKRVTRSKHAGHGGGGPSFYGHRGEVRCQDCGHRWWSTHPLSGRVACASKCAVCALPPEHTREGAVERGAALLAGSAGSDPQPRGDRGDHVARSQVRGSCAPVRSMLTEERPGVLLGQVASHAADVAAHPVDDGVLHHELVA